ncbi:MAG: hypothetical protein H5T98_05860 [Syntrophomonadaceae bacterium]|nr:hypothetical protein [Syntrophomonadaceae bacterium]
MVNTVHSYLLFSVHFSLAVTGCSGASNKVADNIEKTTSKEVTLNEGLKIKKGETFTVKGSVGASKEPFSYSVLKPKFFICSGDKVTVIDIQDKFAKVDLDGSVGWIPSWYLTKGDAEIHITRSKEMIVKTPTEFYLYPSEKEPSGFLLEPGKVVHVIKEYEDWYSVDLMTYDQPYVGDKWIKKAFLSDFNPKLAKEGYVEGSKLGQGMPTTCVLICGEKDSMYEVSAAGGLTATIKKEDFNPNPYEYLRQRRVVFLSQEFGKAQKIELVNIRGKTMGVIEGDRVKKFAALVKRTKLNSYPESCTGGEIEGRLFLYYPDRKVTLILADGYLGLTEPEIKRSYGTWYENENFLFFDEAISVKVIQSLFGVSITPDQSELNPSEAEQVEKDIRQLLVNSLADVATNLKEFKTDDGNTYSIKDPQQWAEYRVSELANLISLTHQLLGDIRDEMRQDQLTSYENRWKNEFLPFLNRIKQGDIIAFKNDINDGFQLATEGIREDNPQKIEQARDIFVKLSEQLPKMSPSKEIMMEDIKSKLLEGYVQVTAEEVKNQSGYDLVTPEYLPERFQHYGIFMRDNPGIPTEKMVKQLWYDPEKFEVLMVTQMKDPSPDREERILFSDGLETPGKISDIFPWAKYRCQYEFTKNGIHVQGYMLVNDESNRGEYERILKSLRQ